MLKSFDVNGRPADDVVLDMLELVKTWRDVHPNMKNANKHGVEIISDFFRVMNLRPSVEFVKVEKESEE